MIIKKQSINFNGLWRLKTATKEKIPNVIIFETKEETRDFFPISERFNRK